MERRKTWLAAITILAVIMLSACQRSASQAPTSINQPSEQELQPITETQVAKALEAEAVQAGTTQESDLSNPASEEPGASEATPASPAVVPDSGRPASYILQAGEWPICIARRFDVDMSTLLAINGLNLDSKPGSGTTLAIPQSGNWSAAHGARALRAHPTDYTVVAGDTLNIIACRFGDVSPEAIMAANGLSDAGAISPGQTLQIP